MRKKWGRSTVEEPTGKNKKATQDLLGEGRHSDLCLGLSMTLKLQCE